MDGNDRSFSWKNVLMIAAPFSLILLLETYFLRQQYNEALAAQASSTMEAEQARCSQQIAALRWTMNAQNEASAPFPRTPKRKPRKEGANHVR